MSTPRIIQHPGGDTASEDLIIGALGQIRIDISRQDIRVHDGVTPGGKRLPNIDAVAALIAALTPGSTYANFTYDAIGSYLLALDNVGGEAIAPGASVAGSHITPAVIIGNAAAGGVRSGTWRCMGAMGTITNINVTLLARIA